MCIDKVYGRVRPSKKADRNLYHIHGGELDFRQPSSQMDVVNNQKELYEFKFSGNFDQDCKQEEIFDGKEARMQAKLERKIGTLS